MQLPKHVWRGLDASSIASPRWSLSQLSGRLVEISGHRAAATLTTAFGLVLEAQDNEEPVAWITLTGSSFFPPDAAESGVDLGALAVVRLPELQMTVRAAVQLTRSGGFGLVVLDSGTSEFLETSGMNGRPPRKPQKIATPLLTKLVGLAQKHDTAVVLLTEKPARSSSLSSLISLRAEARRDKEAVEEIELAVLKDKRRGPGRTFREVCRAPAGLR